MFINLNEVEDGHFSNNMFDIAICGAGVAGITLARKLSNKFNVALCEAGSLEYSLESQEQYQGSISGAEYFPLHITRLRYFGGTSNHWKGWCRPLDEHDFEPNTQNPQSGWPISKSDLDPYSDETREILELSGKSTDSCPAGPEYEFSGFQPIKFWMSPPTRFNRRYRDEVGQSPGINCYLNANVVDFKFEQDSDRIKEMEIRDYANRKFSVSARIFIVAAGGLENPRILLNCNNQRPLGIGNKHDLVGRFFSEHLHFKVGEFIFEDGQKEKFESSIRSYYSCIQSPTPQMLRSEQILNFGLRLRLFRQAEEGAFKQSIRDAICSAGWTQEFANFFRDRQLRCGPQKHGEIVIASEQALNKNSRVLLNNERDRFGQQRIDLHWVRSPVDKRTLLRGAVRFAEDFALNGIGRVQIPAWLTSGDDNYPGMATEETGGHHHMCTTRMADEPRDGVVDRNLTVFGTDNLFVAGSSVFATGGHANPSFTIVQLSLRLADHLAAAV